MDERDYDVIVVGAGCAGAVAAYVAAKAGKSVLMIERGVRAGAKNMTGGRIYSHSLKKVFLHFEEEAPLERKITHERIALATSSSQMCIDFTSAELGEEGKDSYSVLRGPFDAWLAEKVEEAGADCIFGIAVEALLKDETGVVVGIRAGEDEITAQVVIIAEGCNPILCERFLGNPRPLSSQMAVGIKEVFELPSATIEDRFLVPEGEGAAMLFVGDCTKGQVGGGFLYTNKESISLGLVGTISHIGSATNPYPIYQMLEDFKAHPAIAPLLKGAKVMEHSGHMVPEGGYGMIPPYIFDGALVAGEAAGLCTNMGYQVRGMDFAVASGQFAGETAVAAIDAGDVTKAGLADYRRAMEESFVIKDLETFKKWPHVMDEWARMFTEYPAMVTDIFNAMFSVDGEPQKHLGKRVMPLIKQRGLFKLAGEMKGALNAL